MRIRDLDWLLRTATLGHVTDAAAAIGTSQPTLSRALARMEAELGAELFVRTPTGVRTTAAGDLALAAAVDLTERYDRLRADLAALLDPDSGTVRLAFLDSISTSLVPRLLGGFHAEAPGVRVLLRQEPNHEMLADLDAGQVDLAITSPHPEGAFAWHPLQQERLVVVLPPGHRLARRHRLRPADLAEEELVTTPPGFGSRAQLDGLFRAAGVPTRIGFESQDLATIEGLVAAGLGIAILPEQLAGVSGTVGVPLAADGATRTIGLAWRSGSPLPAPAERFRAFVVAQPFAHPVAQPARARRAAHDRRRT